MSFTSEFRNVADPNAPTAESIPISPPAGVSSADFKLKTSRDVLGDSTPAVSPDAFLQLQRAAEANTRSLIAIANWIASRVPPIPKAGIIYFPPGRYYLGRTGELPPLSETGADIVIPPNVSLRFALGATAVLFDYGALPPSARPAHAFRPIEGRPDDALKVSMEIQGSIDAGPWPIFDAVMEDLSGAAGWNLPASALHTAGPIFLTRNTVPEVYPEWFGAALPARFGAPEPTVALVRNFTAPCPRAASTSSSFERSTRSS